jgi:hypothetical protein
MTGRMFVDGAWIRTGTRYKSKKQRLRVIMNPDNVYYTRGQPDKPSFHRHLALIDIPCSRDREHMFGLAEALREMRFVRSNAHHLQ